ncbi:MAG: GNAT family N-acetyltransferase [Candidatus Methanomethylophilaceae archaeon]|nr:GNAT family N-acetyltransferase [Candidatus Methanomethylophilaceae archaeon]
MTDLRFPLEGYHLEGAEDSDNDYLLHTVEESIIGSVPGDEAAASDLWIDDILAVMFDVRRDGGMENELYILRDDNGERAGLLWMGVSRDQFTCDETGYVLQIYVEGHLRRRGLGKALMRSAEEWCREKGLFSMTLNVGSVNKTADRLYRSAGLGPRTVVMHKRLA